MNNKYGMRSIAVVLLALVGLLAAACAGSQPAASAVNDDGAVDQATNVVETAALDDALDDHDDTNGDEAAALEVDGHDDDGHDDAAAHEAEEAGLASLEDDDHAADPHDDGGAVREIALNVVEGTTVWGFDQSVIEVRAGEAVKLTLVNDGMAEHDIEITDLIAEHVEQMGADHGDVAGDHHADTVAAHAMAGTMSSVMFTPTVAGEYEFICTLPGHKELGMVGTLIVLPADGDAAVDDHDADDGHDEAVDDHDADAT